jgi:molybdenum cofactor biosynthesis enzyme MoaA
MCYFTDKNYVKKLKGVFPVDELQLLGKSVLKRAVKLQIGCGTEPTLYKNLTEVIELGKQYKVPYISMTTNANLIEKKQLEEWCKVGLNEITVSLHGTKKETYEEMMGKGDFSKFLTSLKFITESKKNFPEFQLRINYTFNEDNFDELSGFWTMFNDIDVDVLQIRPIRKLGETEYNNYSIEKIVPKYEALYELLKEECEKRNTVFIAPNLEQLQDKVSKSSIVHDFTYFYISPTSFWKKDFDWKNETYDGYIQRTSWKVQLLKLILSSSSKLNKLLNDRLNYDIS